MKNFSKSAKLIALFAILWMILPTITLSDTVMPIPDSDSHMEISVLKAHPDGQTYFSTEKTEWLYWFKSGRRTPETKTYGLQFYHIKKSLSMGFHPAPRKQYLLIIHGTLQIEAGSGEKRDFSPGSIVRVEDVAGTMGHISRVISADDVYAAVMPAP